MSYQTGSLSSINDLITKIGVFVAAHGFTVSRDYTSTDNFHILEINKGGKYWLVAGQTTGTPNYVDMKMASGGALGSNLDWSAIPGTVARSYTNEIGVGPYVAHHFFTSGNTFVASIEYAAGKYVHLTFGYVTKSGTWTGGEFISAVNWTLYELTGSGYHDPVNGYSSALFDGRWNLAALTDCQGKIRWDRDGVTPNYLAFMPSNGHLLTSAISMGRSGNLMTDLFDRSPNTVNGRTILYPMHVFATDATNTFYQLLGVVDGVFLANIKNLSPGDTVDTDYKIFPLVCKNGAAENSGNSGYAFKMS